MAKWKEREADKYTHDKWYRNTWFHYGTVIIVAAVVIVIAVILVFSNSMNDETDMYIFYITSSPNVYTEKVSAIQDTLTKYAPDKNGDGKTVIYVENLYVGDEYDSSAVYKNKEKIMTALRAGSCMFVVADEVGIQYLTGGDSLAELSSSVLTGNYSGQLEYDGCAWEWTGSAFRNGNAAFGCFDSDEKLYFGVRVYENTLATYTESTRKNYAAAETLLKNIASNTLPESETAE